MILSTDDCQQFFKLHKALTFFINQRLKIVEAPAQSKEIAPLPPDQRVKVREALVEHLDLIDAFVKENPYELGQDELEVVQSWKHHVAGQFFVLRSLKKYTIFLTSKAPARAYGVVALSEPFEEVIPQPLPFLCEAVLLPYHGRIIYDGVLSGYKLFIGSHIRKELNDSYNAAKRKHGVILTLPWDAER
jgi:hypothetical protein